MAPRPPAPPVTIAGSVTEVRFAPGGGSLQLTVAHQTTEGLFRQRVAIGAACPIRLTAGAEGVLTISGLAGWLMGHRARVALKVDPARYALALGAEFNPEG